MQARERDFARQLRQQMTEAECLLWQQLRAHRLANAKFRRQQPIGPYIVDFVDHTHHLIIEADGGQHNGSPKDTQRDVWLTAQGYEVLRFWNHDILTQTESVMTAIYLALEERKALQASRKG